MQFKEKKLVKELVVTIKVSLDDHSNAAINMLDHFSDYLLKI